MAKSNEPSVAELKALILKLEAQNQALAASKGPKVTGIKASPKGAVQVNGLGRFPTTLYAEQWEVLLNSADRIREFIKTNTETLSYKHRVPASV